MGNFINLLNMFGHISDKEKWKVLAILLFTLYIVMSSFFAMFRIMRCPDIEGERLTDLEIITSSFIILSPNLLTFAYFVWRNYRYYNKRNEA